MNIKKKLFLIGICVIIILFVFTVNVIKGLKQDKEKDNNIDQIVNENVIIKAEAYRLLSYLEFDSTAREVLPKEIEYADSKMAGWYDAYVNAAIKMGLIDRQVINSPAEPLKFGECKSLIDKLILKEPLLQNIYQELSFDFVNAEKDMLIPEFLEIYETIITILPEDKALVQREVLFVLGKESSEDGKERIVTDHGKYFYKNAKGYEKYFEEYDKLNKKETADTNSDNPESQVDDTVGIEDKANLKDKGEEQNNSALTSSNTNQVEQEFTERYMDYNIHVIATEQEIVYVSSVNADKTVLRNVWIKQGEGLIVDTFVNGIHKQFNAKFKLSNTVEKIVGDITIENQRIIKISVKPDLIKGKVLLAGDDFIEIEGYGKVPTDEYFKIYKIYGELTLEPTSSILVGYETTEFVVSGGKISAAIIKESIKAENIRVLLKTDKFEGIYHKKVELTSNTDFVISSKNNEKAYKAGDTVTIKPGDKILSDGRIKIETKSDQGKIQILSINRSSANPKYRGSIEISDEKEGLLIVNDLPLEEYLYAVIPSEMPTYYGLEPLKVQAVCARSYAYRHLLANSLSEYGAHVDDSVSYQVYNNIAENEDSILAVKDTYGKVIQYNNEVITAYYFSTSCGLTTSVEHVWSNGVKTPYLSGKLLAVDKETLGDGSSIAATYENLKKEENFRKFITKDDITTYDSEFNWYRWNVTISLENIEKVLNKSLLSRFKANPSLILTLVSGSEKNKDAIYESKEISSVGKIENIEILKRENGGIITELLITGSKATIKIKQEYNIRVLLAPTYDALTRKDGTKVENMSLLPSAFFVIDKNKEKDKLSSITISGGGYGHGVGMSQNGVKALADAGKKYEEILTYFYEKTKIGFIYE